MTKICLCTLAGTAACLGCQNQGTGIHWPAYYPLPGPMPVFIPVPVPVYIPVSVPQWAYPDYMTTTTWDGGNV